MKSSVIFFLMLISVIQVANAQKVFSGSRDEYTIKANSNLTTKSMQKEDGGYVDYYILRDGDSFIYMLSITHINMNSATSETVNSNEYKESYLAECGCLIEADRSAEYKGLIGREFKIKTELNGNSVSGYSFATVKSGILFNINFFALDTKFQLVEPDYFSMINSLVLK